MALTQVYNAVPNDVITAARWNNEFGNLYNNGTSVAFPLTQSVSFNGKTITLDAAGATTFLSSAIQGFALLPGTKAGNPSGYGTSLTLYGSTFTDTATAGSGTLANFMSTWFDIPTLAAQNSNVITTDATNVYISGHPLPGTNETFTNAWSLLIGTGDVRFDGGTAGTLVLGKPIGGLTYANAAGDATNDITIAIGEASSDNATLAARRSMVLTAALTKQIDAAWAAGTNLGGMDTGSVANSTEYYIWLIMKINNTVAVTDTVDALFSLSSTAPTMPIGYTYKRLIGHVYRTSGTLIRLFTVREVAGGGIHVQYTAPVADVSLAATLTTSRRTDALSVPLTFSVLAHIRALADDASLFLALVCDPAETDAAPVSSGTPGFNLRNHVVSVFGASDLNIWTSATGTVASRATVATIDTYRIITTGFTWSRR